MSYDPDNIFAKILKGEIPADKVYEDEYCLAFHDINPAAKVHILVIPKGEYISFDDFIHKASQHEVCQFFLAIRTIARDFGLKEDGYRIVSNHGKHGNQTVPHFHFHILGGEQLSGF